eukprot:CAMPEP_0173453032 /NCGR_PEP_ID=MMETSP1357-20121228/49855_1 /TAXON_ID=77926 /ORGANISM="Hemiselmis rufescens, Strain PCC563" /LENGTH=37 /DNA_ID= /DNA_START= /DNA_END= /DNA_ORIENTATION=
MGPIAPNGHVPLQMAAHAALLDSTTRVRHDNTCHLTR